MFKIYKDVTATFDIDCQNGFTFKCPEELPVEGGEEIVDELNAQALFAKYRVGSGDFHPSNSIWIANQQQPQFTELPFPNANKAWNRHCMSGTFGSDLLKGLPKVVDYDYFVFKGVVPDLHPYSPCYHDLNKKMSTGVIEWLKSKGIKDVIVGGLALNGEDTPLCVGEGLLDLNNAGFNVIINLAATRGLGSIEGRDKFIKRLESEGVFLIDNCAELVLA